MQLPRVQILGTLTNHRVALLSLKYLEPGKSLRFCKLPEGDDPDSFFKKHGISEMTKLLSGAAYLVDFLWEYFYETFFKRQEQAVKCRQSFCREIHYRLWLCL